MVGDGNLESVEVGVLEVVERTVDVVKTDDVGSVEAMLEDSGVAVVIRDAVTALLVAEEDAVVATEDETVVVAEDDTVVVAFVAIDEEAVVVIGAAVVLVEAIKGRHCPVWQDVPRAQTLAQVPQLLVYQRRLAPKSTK